MPEKFEKSKFVFNFRSLISGAVPRANLRRQIFMTRAEVWAKNWAKFWTNISGHFWASFAVQSDTPKLLPKFLTPCLARTPLAEVSKFHLCELLGLGAPKKSLLANDCSK